MATATTLAPATFDEAAAALAAATADGRTVRIVGAGTKQGWGRAPACDLELHTGALDAIVEHNAGDMTATLQAGVPLAAAQRAFADAGQMLALDPPLDGPDTGGRESGSGPTIGGIVATGDCGPLRHRYGAPRDLVVGATLALSDGTIARSGGTVIKNVAGYDLAKLFAGAFGTLGLILAINVRLHPLHEVTATAVGTATDAPALGAAALALAALPAELEALDFAWENGEGGLLARCAGPQAHRRARRMAQAMRDAGLRDVDVSEPDGPLWDRQRAGQRSDKRAVVRVAAPPTDLPGVLAAAGGCDGAVVGRAGLGQSFVAVAPAAVTALRADLPPSAIAVLLDAPDPGWSDGDPWGPADPAALALMRAVKARFDPAGTCNPGMFVGGI